MTASVRANPFPGLRPFEAGETHLFFGRDGQSTAIIELMARTRFVGVVGTSGSGKSSLVRAGLLPQLEGGLLAAAGSNWRFAVMKPGLAPLNALARQLARADVLGEGASDPAARAAQIEAVLRRSRLGLAEVMAQARLDPEDNLLVVVDQFEELFRMARLRPADGVDEAADFVALLLEATRQTTLPIYVVLTMRSDYLGDCAQFRDLPEALNRGQYLVPRMSRDERRMAIEGPVAVGGARMAPRLVQQLLNDVGDDPDQLPVMQHALMRTWDSWVSDGRPDEPIDLVHYQRIGALDNALSAHADEALAELPTDADRAIARQVFQRLCERADDYRETRRPTPLKDLRDIAGVDTARLVAVIDRFRTAGRSFLMPAGPSPLDDDTVIDISHEALIRQWKALRTWVDEEAAAAAMYRRLADDAARHAKGEVALWVDPQLRAAQTWRDDWQPTRAWAQRYHPGFDAALRFLDASVAARRRGRVGIGALLALLLLLVLGAPAAYKMRLDNIELTEKSDTLARQRGVLEDQNRTLQTQRATIELQRDALSEKAQSLGQQAESLKQQALALRDARQRAEDKAALARTESQRARQLGEMAMAGRLAVQSLVESNPETAALLAVEALRVARTEEAEAAMWQALARPGLLAPLRHMQVSALTVSSDGRRAATTARDGLLKLWNISDGKLLAETKVPHARGATALALSPNGDLAASIGDGPGLALYRWRGGRLQREDNPLAAPDQPAMTLLSLSPDGQLAATADKAGGVALWRLDGALQRRQPPLPGGAEVSELQFDGSGRWLAVARNNGEVQIVATADGQAAAAFSLGAGQRAQLRFVGETLVVLAGGKLQLRRGADFMQADALNLPAGRSARRLFGPTDGTLYVSLNEGQLLPLKREGASLRTAALLDLPRLSGGSVQPNVEVASVIESSDGELLAITLRVPLSLVLARFSRSSQLMLVAATASRAAVVRDVRERWAGVTAFADGGRQLLMSVAAGVMRLQLGDPGVWAGRQQLATPTTVLALAVGRGATPTVLAVDEQSGVHRGQAQQERLATLIAPTVPPAASRRPASAASAAVPAPVIAPAPDAAGLVISQALSAAPGTPPQRGLAWLPAAGERIDLPVAATPAQGEVRLAAAAAGKRLAWALQPEAGSPARIEVWDPGSRVITHAWAVDEHIKALALSHDGQWLAAVLTDRPEAAPARATRVSRALSVAQRPTPTDASPRVEGRRVAAQLRLWDLRGVPVPQPGPRWALNGDDDSDFALAFGASGRWLTVRNTDDDTLDLIDWRGGKGAGSMQRPMPLAAQAFALSPGESQLATIDPARGVLLHALASEARGPAAAPRRLIAEEAGVGVLAYSADGRWLFGGARDGNLYVWDATTGQPQVRLRSGHQRPITAIGMGADGQIAVTADGSGRLGYWALSALKSMPDVEARLCQQVMRNLSHSAWQAHFKGQAYRRTCPKASVGQDVVNALIAEAWTQADQGQVAAARSQVAQAVALADAISDTDTLNTLCYRSALAGAGKEALPLCRRAVKVDSEDGLAHDSHGIALALAGERAAAVASFRAALAAPGFPDENRAEVAAWARALAQGHNPFDAGTLRRMRQNDRE